MDRQPLKPIVVAYRKRPWIARLFLIDLFMGLAVTIREQFRPHTTVEYPKERIDLRPRFRGVPRLRNHPEVAEELCIACNQCALACPDNCITMIAEARPEGAKLKGKRPKVFVIDYERCCLCGLCVDPCPTEPITAIYMSHDFELAHYSRDRFVTPAEELYTGHDTVEYRK
jgi:NADH-quinone oxidoreductase subunit I